MPLTDDLLLADLNAAQREAVAHFEGPLLILAGAGSGKTRVLTRRAARLIDYHGVEPSRILAVTFTNKAAGEMRDRIAALVGGAPAGMWAGTFHSVGARMLRSAAHLVGRTPRFTIYDEDDSLAVVKRLMAKHRILPREFAPAAIRGAISDAKNRLVAPAEFATLNRDRFSQAVAAVYGDLEAEMRAANAVDFDDLLILPVRILREHAERLDGWRDRFRFILVDEYQDTNAAQYELVRLLGGRDGNVSVVGDDDQSIYGWRGADIRNILDFERDFPNATVVRLEENYRSTKAILDVANAAILPNTGRRGKTLRPTRPGGERVTVTGAVDDRDEADWIAEEIRSRRTTGAARAWCEVAVLYRTNAQSRLFEEALRRVQIPYRLVGAVSFYDRREIRDLIAYLKLIANPSDIEAFRRAIAVPRRGLGDATVDMLLEAAGRAGLPVLEALTRPELLEGARPAARAALAEFAALIGEFRGRAATSGVDELLRDLVERIGYAEQLAREGQAEAEDRLENVRQLIAGAAEQVIEEGGEIGLTPLDHFLQRASLVAQIDQLDPDADAVALMTVHNAKGLEFPIVFLAGLEDGLFPLAKAFDEPAMLEEERRLFYVGITRAGRSLYLTHARARRRQGESLPSIPSSFLTAIPPALVEERATLRLRATGRPVMPQSAAMRRPGTPVVRPARPRAEDADFSQDLPRFVKGERVRHRRFGDGTIAELTGVGRETKVTVDFDDESVGRKRLVVAYAGLEKGIE